MSGLWQGLPQIEFLWIPGTTYIIFKKTISLARLKTPLYQALFNHSPTNHSSTTSQPSNFTILAHLPWKSSGPAFQVSGLHHFARREDQHQQWTGESGAGRERFLEGDATLIWKSMGYIWHDMAMIWLWYDIFMIYRIHNFSGDINGYNPEIS